MAIQPPTGQQSSVMREKLQQAGLRTTKQRLMLAHLLFGSGNRHVTAEILYAEASKTGLGVSLATIYNTLNQFHEAGLLCEVIIDQNRSYFDTNLHEHHHFFVESDARLIDINEDEISLGQMPDAPDGFQTDSIQVVIRLKDA